MQIAYHNLYDSHVHFLSVGMLASGLKLQAANSVLGLKKIQIKNEYFMSEWLYGFGWNENNWVDEKPHRKLLDEVFPDFPVFFSRVDGHSSWLNSMALHRLNIKNSETGILTGKDHFHNLQKLPVPNEKQIEIFLLQAQSEFLKAGFTHVRDLSTTIEIWNCLNELYHQEKLNIAFEGNRTVNSLADFQSGLTEIQLMKQTENNQMRILGIKVFCDGSLGSESAYLSDNYYRDANKGHGKIFWQKNDMQECMKKTWQAGFEFSVHCIGDQAIDDVVEIARKLSAQGVLGRLNIEHAEIVRSETIKKMKPLHVRCFMQPCHWLNDQRWLKEKLPHLYQFCFPWEALRRMNIPIHFGSDAPVEPISLKDNLRALSDSTDWGILELKKPWNKFFEHPDPGFFPHKTVFKIDQQVLIQKIT